MSKKGVRGWCWTWFNYTETTVEQLKQLKCQYMVFGKEICPTTGRAHLQGATYLHDAKTKTAFQAWIGNKTMHVEVTKGEGWARNYCKKDGLFYEHGKRPMSKQEKGVAGGGASVDIWDETLHLAKQGRFEEIQPRMLIQHNSTLKKIHNDELKKYRLENITHKHIWIYGKTRVGKNTAVDGRYPMHFPKQMGENWDGYDNHEVVHINDFGPGGKGMITYMKWWLDIYPFPARFLYTGCKSIRPELIIITSNYLPNEIWTDPSELDPILSRVNIHHFLEETTPIYKLQDWIVPKRFETRMSLKEHLANVELEKEAQNVVVHQDLLNSPVVVDVPVPPLVEAVDGLDVIEEAAVNLAKDDPEYVFENVDYLFDDLDERTSDSGSHCKD